MRNTLAVIDDQHFLSIGGKKPHGKISTLENLIYWARSYKFSHVWVVPGCLSDIGGRQGIEEAKAQGWNIISIGKDRISFMSARRNDETHESMTYIGFVEYSRWPWKATGNDAAGLLRTIARLETALMLEIEWTPAHMAMEVGRQKNANRWWWLQPMTFDLEAKGFSYTNDIARELHWPPRGQQTDIPGGASYEISLDANSAYAAAMISLNVGEGDPNWADGTAYDGKVPGFWRVEVKRTLEKEYIWDGEELPGFEQRKWMTTDLIEQLRRSGFDIAVQAGWYWGYEKRMMKEEEITFPRFHQTLRSTAEHLWKLRVEWRAKCEQDAVNKNIYESISQIIKAIHGKMADEDYHDRHLRRRDIWALVVAKSVALTIYRAEKIYRLYGLKPIRIKADELTYAVSDPHIFDGLIDGNKLGGLKLARIVHL